MTVANVTEDPYHILFKYQGTDFLFKKDGKFEGWSRIRPCDPLEVEVRKLKAAGQKVVDAFRSAKAIALPPKPGGSGLDRMWVFLPDAIDKVEREIGELAWITHP